MSLVGASIFLSLLSVSVGVPVPTPPKIPNFPRSMTEYFQQREALLELEKSFERGPLPLSEDEKIVGQFLGYLKWKEMNETLEKGFPSSRPIQEILPHIHSSELYRHLVKFPKGGNLHSHFSLQVSKRDLFDILWRCKDFEHLHVLLPRNDPESTSERSAWSLDFFVNPPEDENWVKVKDSGYSKEQLLANYTLIEILDADSLRHPTDSALRWKLFHRLLSRSAEALNHVQVKREYLLVMYERSMQEGVSYIETRTLYGPDTLYELDPSGSSRATHGKRFLNAVDLTFELRMIVEQVDAFRSLNPGFVGHKIILSAVRSRSREKFLADLDVAIRLHALHPNHVIGFDTAKEEDDGYSNLYFVESYLSGNGSIPLYLHSVETSWPEDLLVGSREDDLLPPLQNAYEVVLLQSRRVGHGKGFLKKPFLRRILKEKNVAVEVCPTSNQILGYDPDLRNHFGQLFYREGIPIVLGSDDQALFGWDDGLALDWYSVFMSWGLNLGDLKRLALNSIEYSGMTDEEKRNAIDNYWTPSWNEYISGMKGLACSRNFESEARLESRFIKFNQVLPSRAPAGTRVYVFGRNFEAAICKKIECDLGGKRSDAVYVSNQRLSCLVPECPECDNVPVPVRIFMAGGRFEITNLNFTYEQHGSSNDSGRPIVNSMITMIIVAVISPKLFKFGLTGRQMSCRY